MTISEALAAWHRTIEGGSHPEDLAGIIADDAVFHSPVVHLIRFDESGRIVDFKVMIRPLKAVNKIWELMAARLERGAGGG